MVSSTIKFREFRLPSDYESVYQLWVSIETGIHVGRSDTLAEIEKKIVRDPDLFLVAESRVWRIRRRATSQKVRESIIFFVVYISPSCK